MHYCSLSLIVFPHSAILCHRRSKFVIHMSGSSFFFIQDSFNCLISFIFLALLFSDSRLHASAKLTFIRSLSFAVSTIPNDTCLEYNIVVDLHTLLCSFYSCCIASFGLASGHSVLPASLSCHQMELPPVLLVHHDIHVSLPEPKKSCATYTILSSFLSKECTSHFF